MNYDVVYEENRLTVVSYEYKYLYKYNKILHVIIATSLTRTVLRQQELGQV